MPDQPLELPSWALAGIRTGVQAAVGFLVGWLAMKNITLPSADLFEGFLFTVTAGGAAAFLRWAERRWPWITRVMSLFLTATKPVYLEPKDVAGAVSVTPNLTTAKAA